MNERDEIDKLLRLGHETLGPAGVRAMAKAMGLGMGGSRATTGDRWIALTSTGGGATVAADEGQALENPAMCPKMPPRGASGWRPYVGYPEVFHCGFEGYLEDRDPSPDRPIAECFYDERGRLVDDGHPYAGCKGTADNYGAYDPRHWLWTDPGEIWAEGAGGYRESQRYLEDQERHLGERLGRPYWRRFHRDGLSR